MILGYPSHFYWDVLTKSYKEAGLEIKTNKTKMIDKQTEHYC